MTAPESALQSGAMNWDVIVVGGGPGGSVCAGRLAQLGHKVLILERDHFPRFHLGESLLPQSLYILDGLGVLDAVRERFIQKNGARFHNDLTGGKARFAFELAFDSKYPYAFQVPRDEFDELLLRNSQRLGVEVREGWTVGKVRFDGTRAVGVDATDPDGKTHAIDARFIVDATGRDALLAHVARSTERIERLDKSAFYSHYHDIPRVSGPEAGDIDIVIFGGGWFWFIPFKDGRTSVGAVVGSEWVKAHRSLGDATAMLLAAIDQSATAKELTANAVREWPAKVAADFSYRVRERFGDGWLMVGDAGGFIDPLFSSGAHVAMTTGSRAATAIDEALKAGDVSKARFDAWAADTKLGCDTFIDAVQAFYGGGLLKYLFAEKQHTVLRRSITSLLSGDVFAKDTRWLNDTRTRLAEMNKADWKPDAVLGT